MGETCAVHKHGWARGKLGAGKSRLYSATYFNLTKFLRQSPLAVEGRKMDVLEEKDISVFIACLKELPLYGAKR